MTSVLRLPTHVGVGHRRVKAAHEPPKLEHFWEWRGCELDLWDRFLPSCQKEISLSLSLSLVCPRRFYCPTLPVPTGTLHQAVNASEQMGVVTDSMENTETDPIPVLAILYPHGVSICNCIFWCSQWPGKLCSRGRVKAEVMISEWDLGGLSETLQGP